MSSLCKYQDKAKKKMAGLVRSRLKGLETEELRLRSLKRNFDYHTEDCPSAKKFITEEVMVSYLEQLNLATRENGQLSSMDKLLQPLQTLSLRKAAACQDTAELATRKRHFDCDLPEKEMDTDLDTDDLQIIRSRTKRLRVDVASNLPAINCGSAYNVRTVHYHHAESPTMVPSLNIGGKSDLSSIPEGCETTQRLPEGTFYGHKLKIELDDDSPISVEDRESHIHFPLPPPPPSIGDHQSSFPTDIRPHLWVAPELQSFCTSKKSLLPACIVKEIWSQGMELVPYVGSATLTSFLASKSEDSQDSMTSSKDEDNKDGPLSLGMHKTTYLSNR